MGKKTLTALLLALGILLSGCASPAAGPPDASEPPPAQSTPGPDGETPVTQSEDFPFEIDADGYVRVPQAEWGYELGIPREAMDKNLINISQAVAGETAETHPIPGLYRLYIDFLFPGLLERIDSEAMTEAELSAMIRTLAQVNIFDQARYDGEIAAGKTPDQIVGEGQSREVGRQEGYVYLYTLMPKDTKDMDDGTLAQYEALYEKGASIGDKIRTIPIEVPEAFEDAETPEAVPAFQAADLQGEAVTSAVFERQKLTMLNIWATFCGPCIDEMPDLGNLARTMPEGSQLVGIVSDIEGNEALAKQILSESGVDASFLQIAPDAALTEFCMTYPYVPTTLFVDAAGKIVGEPLVGPHSEAEYREEIEARLSGLGGGK